MNSDSDCVMEESVKENINDTEVRNLNSRSGGGSDILVMDTGGV